MQDVLPIALLFVFGLCLGSFGSVLVTRIPASLSIDGRSRCPQCGVQVAARDLIPVLSFLLLRGRCRNCQRKIPLSYPLLEIFSGALLILPSLILMQIAPESIAAGIALWLFCVIALCDARTQSIPDALSFPLVAVGLITGALAQHLTLAAPLFGGGFFLVQWLLSRGRVTGSGDILIGIAMGLLLGTWQRTLLALGIAYISGAVVASVGLLTGHLHRHTRIAFVPYLFAGTLTATLLGERLIDAFSFPGT